MKRASKVLAILMALALVMGFAAMSASAIEGTTSTQFTKNFVVGEDVEVLPDVTFTFTVTAGTPVDGSSQYAQILAGPTNPGPTITSAAFNSSSTLNSGSPTDANASNKYASTNVNVDFSGVTFPAPGIYRYVVTENGTSYPGVSNDPEDTRYLDVIVLADSEDADQDGNTTELIIDSYVMRDAAENIDLNGNYVADPTTPGAKSSGYTNTYDTVDLEFAKTISGNQADMNEKFTFTLSITDAIPGQYVIDIDGTNVTIDGTGGSGVSEGKITVGSDGTYTGTFSLTNGESVKVLNLPVGYSYTLEEDAKDYTSTGGTAASFTDGTVGQDGKITGSDVNADISTGFNNAREGIIPTGVIITIAPFVIGLLLFGAVMMFMISRRRRAAY